MSKPHPEFTLTVLCDLSKAFDVINYDILLKKMNNYGGIRGIAHTWFQNYLFDRHQFVEFGRNVSDKVPIIIGIPQGSILSPLL